MPARGATRARTRRATGRNAVKFCKMIAALALFAWSLGGSATPGSAQPWPTRTVTIVTPFAAGSVTDVTARIMGTGLQEAPRQPFIVENKPGARGMIAAQA